MITRKMAFIIGAGASAEYGFPLGSGLVSRIVTCMATPNTPLLRALHLAGHNPAVTDRFRHKLQGSDSDSIDTFLENNQEEFVQIGKAAIAYAILEAEAQCRSKARLIEHPPDDHWLKYLWNSLRSACTVDTLPFNTVAFITFNYDRLLETYFDTVIQHAFNISPSDATSLRCQAFPIVHLHGQLSQVDFGYFEDAPVVGKLTEIAGGIRVVHDTVPVADPEFSSAISLIAEARNCSRNSST